MIKTPSGQNRWAWIGTLAVLMTLLLFLAGCGSRLEPAQQASIGEHAGEIRGERSVGQTFVTQHDGLQAVDVLLATFSRQNTHPITFHLRSNPQSKTDLRTVTVSAAEIADNVYQRFSFEPVPDSHHQRYYFFIDSRESQPGDAITAWIGPADGYREGSLYVDGQPQEGQMAFRLSYSNSHIVLGLVRDILRSLPAVLATGALFILPGLALLVWLAPVWQWGIPVILIVAAGLSAALFPLLLLFSRPLGVHWSSALVWGFLLLCIGLIVWRLQRLAAAGHVRLPSTGSPKLVRLRVPEAWLLLAAVTLVLGVRWLVARPLSVPLWGDSHQHTYIAQLVVENGGLFDTWEPYSPFTSLTVHFGFHAAVAFFHWATGIDILRSVILVGQLFNALAVLALYPLAVRISRAPSGSNDRVRWAGVAAVLVAGLLMPMPMEYVNWGRYPQLAGQMILLVALWLLWFTADDHSDRGWSLVIPAAIAAAGMTLTYYRMPYYYATFVLAWVLCYCFVESRGQRGRWLALIKRLTLLGLLVLVLIMPWSSNIEGGRLAAAVARGAGRTPVLERVWAEYRLWSDIDQYVPVFLGVLSIIALVWSLVRRQWTVTMLGVWTALLASLVATQLIHLPGASHMQTFAILIALYMPVGLLVGWLVGRLAALAARRWEPWGAVVVATGLLVAALLGFRERMAVVDPAYALVNRPDEVAMDWVRVNTPSDAVFLVNGFPIYGGRYVAGSDAGWWIPFLAGRKNTMPPQYALFNEAEAVPGYRQAVVQLVADLEKYPPTTSEGLKKLCAFGVTHVYVGQGQGKVAAESLTPYLNPADLVASGYFDLIYHQDRVWVFAVRDEACS